MDDFATVNQFTTANTTTLPLLGLSESEMAMIEQLQAVAMYRRSEMLLSESYYLGEQILRNLRIAVPKELEFLRTIVGWPAIAVDPLVERLAVDGFRLPDANDTDTYLNDLWDANNGAAEQSLAFTDALSMGRTYWSVGSPLEKGGPPNITVESPLNMAVLWDLRGIEPKAAMQEYWSDGRLHGALLVPGKTVHLAQDDKGVWTVVDRDAHGFGFVPVIRMANRPRTNNRDGSSEITPAMRSITDAACRTLLGLEVAREIYSVPQRIILGATEADFQKSDGTPKTAFDTYMTSMLALERDDEGNVPELKQMQAYDPAVFTKLIDMYASQMAGQLAAPPQDLGLYTDGNPVTAEAAGVAEQRRDRRAILKQSMWSGSLAKVMQTALRFENSGRLPSQYERLAVDWRSVAMDSVAMFSTAIKEQVDAGVVPPTSDVVRKRLGYSSIERQRLERDQKREDGRRAAKAIAASLIPPAPTGASDGSAAAGL